VPRLCRGDSGDRARAAWYSSGGRSQAGPQHPSSRPCSGVCTAPETTVADAGSAGLPVGGSVCGHHYSPDLAGVRFAFYWMVPALLVSVLLLFRGTHLANGGYSRESS
jgi:hypothetical protein